MDKSAPLKIGILGAAKISPEAIIKPANTLAADAQVVAIAARDTRRAEEFAHQHRIARVFDSYEALIADPSIDAIYNPLPNSHHCEWSIRAMRAGKHVLCEKPIGSNAGEAERMAKVAHETRRFLGEAFHYRYHPAANRMREIIRGGALGKLNSLEGRFTVPIPPENIRYDWALAGGATMDLGCYPLHMLREFSGLSARVLSANAVTGPEKIDVSMDAELDLEGVAGTMVCSMATTAQLAATFTARGDRGEVTIMNPVAPHLGNQITLKTRDGEKSESVEGDTSYTHQLRAFVAWVRGEGEFPTDGDAGIAGMKIIDDVYRAAGLPVRAS
jgi:predicted dehydrogenase